MKKFLLLYKTPPAVVQKQRDKMARMTKDEIKASMQPWFDWQKAAGSSIIDFGAPFKSGKLVFGSKPAEPASYELTGYCFIQAEDIAKVHELVKDHPHFMYDDACSIEIHECIKMSQDTP